MATENKRRIAEVIVLALYFVLDAFAVWPESHLAALAAVAIGISAVLLMEMPWRLWAVATTLVIGLAAFTYMLAPPILPKETQVHGWLLPASDPSPKTACPSHPWGSSAGAQIPDKMIVALGRSGVAIPSFGKDLDAEMEIKAHTAKHFIIKVGECDALTITRSDNGLLIDADVRTPTGEAVANIQANEFHTVQAQYAWIERPDRSTLIIRGKREQELFWLRFLNQNSVKVRGSFSCEGARTVSITEDAVAVNGNRITDSCFMSYPGSVAFRY